MPTPAPAAPPPGLGLLDGILVLPAKAKLLVGIVMLAMGAVGIALDRTPYSFGLLGATLVFGVPLLVSGRRGLQAERIEHAERARAETELPALRDAVAAAVAQRHSVGRLLRQRGYTSAKVRRWIALECDVVLARTDA